MEEQHKRERESHQVGGYIIMHHIALPRLLGDSLHREAPHVATRAGPIEGSGRNTAPIAAMSLGATTERLQTVSTKKEASVPCLDDDCNNSVA